MDTDNTNPTEKQSSAVQYVFTAEIQKLLDILIHSLYTHKEVFLRELVSNASDALDKVRFMKMTGNTVRDPDLELGIQISVDKDKNILTVSDTGVGMTREELVENIGTIAHSGSKSFLQKLSQNQSGENPLQLIGQFGVGFYSVFMVAQKVEILTLSANADATAYLWTSEGLGNYSIEPTTKEKRGTEIRLFLKEDAGKEYTQDHRIRETIQRYSDFVSYPIHLGSEKINKLSAIWLRSPNDIKEEEYKEHYNYLTHTEEKPALYLHLSVDAPIQFRAILYVPSSVPFDILHEIPEKWHGLHLYAKRIFIQSDCEQLLPRHMRFLRGIVDSDDLPLNISRETLQENSLIEKIKQTIVRKVLERLEKLSEENPEEYKKFWENFGYLLKLGYRHDYANREKLAKIFRFSSSSCAGPEEYTSLDQYVSRMRPGQKDIYYLVGEDFSIMEKSPHLEIFRKKGVEVLYLAGEIDEFLMHDMGKFQDKELIRADKEDVSLDAVEAPAPTEEEKKKDEQPKENVDLSERALDDFINYLKDLFKDKVADVRLSKRLKDSPYCLAMGKDSISVTMQKVYSRMFDKQVPNLTAKHIFEINQDHPLIRRLAGVYSKTPQETLLSVFCYQMLDNAMIMEGVPLETRHFVERTQSLMEALAKRLID